MAPKDEAQVYHDGGDSDDHAAVQQHELYGKDSRKDETTEADEHAPPPPNNKYVLNVAFYSFVFFCILEGMFALLANSQSMLADAMAMSIDALTYLFNLAAEHYKNQPLPERLSGKRRAEQEHYRELRRLYLELVPPTISVTVLMAITISTCQEALHSLFGNDNDGSATGNEEESVSVTLMFIFSAANLLLDLVNVTCFSRAHATYGLNINAAMDAHQAQQQRMIRESLSHVTHRGGSTALHHHHHHHFGHDHHHGDEESQRLVVVPSYADEDKATGYGACDDEEERSRNGVYVNLNMCSAWTHVCADTLRSTAVLIAAGLAFVIPTLDGETADSAGAITVSIIIMVSLIPLIQGLVLTALSIHKLRQNPPRLQKTDTLSTTNSTVSSTEEC